MTSNLNTKAEPLLLEAGKVRAILEKVDAADIDGWVYVNRLDQTVTYSQQQVEAWVNVPENVFAITTPQYLKRSLLKCWKESDWDFTMRGQCSFSIELRNLDNLEQANRTPLKSAIVNKLVTAFAGDDRHLITTMNRLLTTQPINKDRITFLTPKNGLGHTSKPNTHRTARRRLRGRDSEPETPIKKTEENELPPTGNEAVSEEIKDSLETLREDMQWFNQQTGFAHEECVNSILGAETEGALKNALQKLKDAAAKDEHIFSNSDADHQKYKNFTRALEKLHEALTSQSWKGRVVASATSSMHL